MKRIKKGDEVVVICGKDKGRRGIVIALMADRVTVEGVNIVKKHRKPSGNAGGGIQEKEQSLHVSNVMLYDAVSKKPSRIGFKYMGNGKKLRYFKSTGELIHE
jgi:large subunit ribosomal protein L24